MTTQNIIDKTVLAIKRLPHEKAEEISDFADFVLKRFEEEALTSNIQKITSDSNAFKFLADDEDVYSTDDIKEKI